MSGERIAVYAGDRNVYSDMVTAVKSLLMHNVIDKVYLLIEDNVFPFPLPKMVETVNVSRQMYFPPDGANTKCRFSYMALMRAVLADIFPQYDKVLSLDIDTIVTGDISWLWDINLDGYYFAACPEPTSKKGERNQKNARFYYMQDEYYNVGVAMYNLKMLRGAVTKKVVRMLNEEPFYSVEQDVFNIVCGGKILSIPSKYNTSDWTAPTNDPVIIHYAGIPLKRWREELLVREYAEMPMESVMAANRKLQIPHEEEERIVVYSGTRNLYGDMVTAVKSLLNSTPIDKVYLLIEDDELEGIPDDVDCVEVLNVSDQPYFPLDSPNAQTILTYMVLMRAAYHKLFKQHKKVLSLDVDTIIARDISGLWDYDLSDYYYAAVLEPPCSKGGIYEKREKYYNNGVILMNLEKFRDGTGDAIMRKINSGKTEAQEQGVFNELCAGKILPLPVAYNSQNDWTGYAATPKVIHYAGDRRWQQHPELNYYRNLRFEKIMERQRKWRHT